MSTECHCDCERLAAQAGESLDWWCWMFGCRVCEAEHRGKVRA